MQRTANFRRDHVELVTIIGKISGLITQNVVSNSGQIRSLLSNLSGLLKLHLAAEDKGLYPQLLNGKDVTLKAMAERYATDMGGLKATWEAYLGRWPSSMSIEAKPDPFRKETTELFQIVTKRIERENNELYNRVDSLN